MSSAKPTKDPIVTPELMAKHALIPEEFERIKKILGCEPDFTRLTKSVDAGGSAP